MLSIIRLHFSPINPVWELSPWERSRRVLHCAWKSFSRLLKKHRFLVLILRDSEWVGLGWDSKNWLSNVFLMQRVHILMQTDHNANTGKHRLERKHLKHFLRRAGTNSPWLPEDDRRSEDETGENVKGEIWVHGTCLLSPDSGKDSITSPNYKPPG